MWSATIVWLAELMLCRLTFGAQQPQDAVASYLGLTTLALCLAMIGRHASDDDRRNDSYVAVAGHLPLAMVCARICSTGLNDLSTGMATLAALLMLLGVLALGFRRRVPLPHPMTLGVALGASVLAALYAKSGLSDQAVTDGVVTLRVATHTPPLDLLLGAGLGIPLMAAFTAWKRPTLVGAVALGLPWSILPHRPIAPVLEATPSDKPDVVLISIDTLRADHAAHMQSLQKVADHGVRFDQAMAPAPWTLPSMATLLTGAPPRAHGAARLDPYGFGRISEDASLLGETFNNAGYGTAAVLAPNVFVGESFGFGRGIDHVDHFLAHGTWAVPSSAFDAVARPLVPDMLVSLGVWGRTDFGAVEHVMGRAKDILKASTDGPTFLWVHLLDCHHPYRHVDDVPDLDTETWFTLTGGDLKPYADAGRITPEDLKRVYDHEIEAVDRSLLDFLQQIEARGRPTLVAITSDHGEEFLEHGDWLHGHALYQELLHIPLVIGAFHMPAPIEGVVTEPVALADVAPTLAAAAGLTHPVPGADGGVVLSAHPRRRTLTSWNLLYGLNNRWARRSGPRKVMGSPKGLTHVFDLASDPDEQRNQAPGTPDDVDLLGERPSMDVAQDAAGIDGDAGRMLEVLGYVE